MSEPTTKRKKSQCDEKAVASPLSPQERVFFTRDCLVGLIVPRLLTHDNVHGIMDLGALYGTCRRMRELVGTNFLREFEAMRRWIEERRPEGDPRCTPNHALVVGAMASFRYFLHFFYQKTVPEHREGESREAAWDRQWHEPLPGLSRVYMTDYMFIVRQCAWEAGQRGQLEAVQDIANMGIAAMVEECAAKRAGLLGKAMLSRPLKIAMKGAASRGRTQMCKDIFAIYCNSQRTAPHEVVRRQFSPLVTGDPYPFFVRGMRYAAMYGHEETARECMRLGFSPESHYVSESEILGVVCGPLTKLFDELDPPPARRQIRSYWWYMTHALVYGQFDMMVHLGLAMCEAKIPMRMEDIGGVVGHAHSVRIGRKHFLERATPEELAQAKKERQACEKRVAELMEAAMAARN